MTKTKAVDANANASTVKNLERMNFFAHPVNEVLF
jgi:hypothetical protein